MSKSKFEVIVVGGRVVDGRCVVEGRRVVDTLGVVDILGVVDTLRVVDGFGEDAALVGAAAPLVGTGELPPAAPVVGARVVAAASSCGIGFAKCLIIFPS